MDLKRNLGHTQQPLTMKHLLIIAAILFIGCAKPDPLHKRTKEAVERYLKAPTSATFTEFTTLEMGDTTIVSAKVTAQNVAGVPLTADAQVWYVKIKGKDQIDCVLFDQQVVYKQDNTLDYGG